MKLQLHLLHGCSPTPLASYLKALGILRLVGEQADPQARGWWQGMQFHLLTSLSKLELEDFFLNRYEPSPLLSPWNKGCGFFKTNDPGLTPLENSVAPRFSKFREGIAEARELLDAITEADAVIRSIKARTKTNKSFQTDAQRELLKSSRVFLNSIDLLHAKLTNPIVAKSEQLEIEEEISIIESLSQAPLKTPSREDANSLKVAKGYRRVLADAERQFKSLKAALVPQCQRLWRGPHAEWLAAAVVLDEQCTPDWPSLLGTGGNDGNLDFTNNFMQQLGVLFDLKTDSGTPSESATTLLKNALWRNPVTGLLDMAVGQFSPGSAGGANSSTGFSSGNLVNPWDFVLMMEGSVLFSGRSTRRLAPNELSRASAPFVVRSHAAGFPTPGNEKAQRGEQWMPLWTQPATFTELRVLYSEARVQLKRQTANRPIELAQAISRFGVARGIESFVRFGYLERNGQATLAVPLGRVQVKHHPRDYLIGHLTPWMNRLQRCSLNKNAPIRLVSAERRLAETVLAALTHNDNPARWQAILQAAVDIESLQATGTATEAGPIPPLSPDWVAAINDNSPEFRLALSLGSAFGGERWREDPVRHHWLPLKDGARQFQLESDRLIRDPRVVIFGRDPLSDLLSVVERRLIEASQRGQRHVRLIAAQGCAAFLSDVAEFVNGSLDLSKITGLARALMAIKWAQWDGKPNLHSPSKSGLPDEGWLAVRLCCLPWPLSGDIVIPTEIRMVRLLTSGQSCLAVKIALDRLRATGIRSPLRAGVTDATSARRWAAALAFPISKSSALRAARILAPSMK